MPDLTLAQAMEEAERANGPLGRACLGNFVEVLRVLAAEIRRRDAMVCGTCARQREGCCSLTWRESKRYVADNGLGPSGGWTTDVVAIPCSTFGHGCRAWQKREGE